MSSEPAEARRQKRIVEYIISGFKSAHKAITFGNTVASMVSVAIGEQLYQLSVANPNSMLAITEDWQDDATLKIFFRELKDQNVANFIAETAKKAVENHNAIYPDKIKIDQEVIREKPQPQFMSVDYIPKTSRVNQL